MRLSMANTGLGLHILEVSEGTYTTAHRHAAGAHVIVVDGEGYEFLFMPGDEMNPENRTKVWVQPGSVIAPMTGEFHQHFNVGTKPFRQLAVRGGPARYGSGSTYDPRGAARGDNPNDLQYKLSFTLEDPNIRGRLLRRARAARHQPPPAPGRPVGTPHRGRTE